VVKFDRTIPPGQSGKINLSVHVYKEWAGRKFNKRALVHTNAPNMNRFVLSLSGQVAGGEPSSTQFKSLLEQ
jgi:hypothetical protein